MNDLMWILKIIDTKKMELLMSTPNLGIITLLMLAVMIFFQVIIHNTQENKRFKEIQDRLKEIEDKLNRTEEK